MKIPYNHYRKVYLEREHRLCRFGNESLPEKVGASVGAFAEYMSSTAIDASSGLYKGLENAWNKDFRSQEEKKQSIAMLTDFQFSMPQSITKIISDGIEKEDLSLKDIDALVKYEDWIVTLEDPNLFNKPVKPLALKDGPMGVLLSVEREKRRELLFDFAKQFIPQEVRDQHKAEYDSILQDSDTISGPGRGTAIGTLKTMFGMETPQDPNLPEYKLAEASLRHRYWMDGTQKDPNTGKRFTVTNPKGPRNPTGTLNVNGTTATLFEDVKKQMKSEPSLQSSAQLPSVLPPSLLRGAMNMGVVGNEEFADLDTYLDEHYKEKVESGITTRKKTLELSGVVEENLRKEMTGFTEIFENMGGVEKVVFIAYAIGLFTGKLSKAVTAVGGLYFVQKFFLKMDNPIDEFWSPAISGMTKKFTNITKPGMEALGMNLPKDPASIEDINQLSNMMSTYVSESVRNNAESAAQGFAFLSEMPLNQLSNYAVIGSTGKMVLDGGNPTFKKLLRMQLRSKGIRDHKVLGFFTEKQTNPDMNVDIHSDDVLQKQFGNEINKNLVDAGSALSHVYFTIGAEKVGPASEALKIVEFARKHLGGNYDLLPTMMEYQGKMVNPREEYRTLVQIGQQNAGQVTLGDFVRQKMGMSNKTLEQKENEKQRRFEVNRDALMNHLQNGTRYKLEANRAGDTAVEIGIPGNPDYKLSVTLDEFIGNRFDPEDLTDRWIQKTEADLNVDPTNGFIVGTTLGSMQVNIEGNVVKFTVNTIARHQTSLTAFKKYSKADFYKKIDAWFAAGHDVSVDPLD